MGDFFIDKFFCRNYNIMLYAIYKVVYNKHITAEIYFEKVVY